MFHKLFEEHKAREVNHQELIEMKMENEMKDLTDKPKVSNKTKRLADINRQKKMEKEKQ